MEKAGQFPKKRYIPSGFRQIFGKGDISAKAGIFNGKTMILPFGGAEDLIPGIIPQGRGNAAGGIDALKIPY